jgi:tetratricopeptide (TPR) repeat protein
LKEIESHRDFYRDKGIHKPRFANELSGGQGAYAELLLRLHDFKEARKQANLALDSARERAADDRNNTHAQRYYAMCLFRLGVIEARAGNPDKAKQCYQECLDIRTKLADRDSDNPSRKLDFMMALARVGRTKEAVELGAALRQHAEKKPYPLVMLACGYACCVEWLDNRKMPLTETEKADKEKWTTAAMNALEAAAKLGYASPIALETEEDLAGIFGDPRFKAYIARMRKK